MRHLRIVLCLVLCVVCTITPSAQVHKRRLRAMDPLSRSLVELGNSGSPLFRVLVSTIEESDLIVYVQTSDALPRDLDGRLQFVSAVKGARYLRITIRRDLPRDRLIALVGHELMHAVEIAADRSVVDQATLRLLYERIGDTHDRSRFDSSDAVAAGYRVLAELRTESRGTRR